MTNQTYSICALFCLMVMIVLPNATFAQSSQTDLQTAVRTAILSDPRSGSLPPDEIDAMVNALTAKAVASGMTAHDIMWRPVTVQNVGAAAQSVDTSGCGSMPGFVCSINEAFGLSGSSPLIPIGFGITSALLILIIGAMLEMHHRQGAKGVVPPITLS